MPSPELFAVIMGSCAALFGLLGYWFGRKDGHESGYADGRCAGFVDGRRSERRESALPKNMEEQA